MRFVIDSLYLPIEKKAVRRTYIFALPYVQRYLAFNGWQTAIYLSIVTQIVK